MQVAARLLQTAYERDRLATLERGTVERATQAAEALASANETLRETNEIKVEFVSLVSHELRTPLTSIVGLARTAHDRWDELDEDQLREFQLIIAEQGERLGHLVNELLLIGRIEEGRLTPDVDVVDLHEVADHAIVDSGANDVVLTVERPPERTMVCTDRMLLHEVLVNYLSNARKYGEPPIELRFERDEDELVVVVSDHGETIDPEFRPKLFERFTRGQTAADRPGTGLGLAIVQEVSGALGGHAWYEPRPDGGNCFGVRFRVDWLDHPSVRPARRASLTR
jgi:signal transduction histidine kinase